MILSLSVSLALGVCVLDGTPTAAHRLSGIDSAYRALYESGERFTDFVARADRRKEQWEGNYARGVAPDALVTRARAAGSGWRLLVVTVPGCSDSVNSIPYVASFLERVPGVEMRLVSRDAGLSVMESHRTPDGRPATPTVVLLDAGYNERGCWIERPAPLRTWLAERAGTLATDALFDGKMKWYDEDAGLSSLTEIVEMIEAAAVGRNTCETGETGRVKRDG